VYFLQGRDDSAFIVLGILVYNLIHDLLEVDESLVVLIEIFKDRRDVELLVVNDIIAAEFGFFFHHFLQEKREILRC